MLGLAFVGSALGFAVALGSTGLVADGAWRADVAWVETGWPMV